MEDGYCVKWEKHHNAIVSVFDNLYKHNVLVDCTLAAENKFIKAHRIVLMACSPYFEDLLSQHCDNYPIVWMNMKFTELQALIDFCYRGEVRLPQAELPGFLNAARLLHIKGLCESSDNYRKRRHTDSEGGLIGNIKKKHRSGDSLVNQVIDGVDSGDVLSSNRDVKEEDDDDSNPEIVQTNGDSMVHVQGDDNSDRSDLDTDDDSSAGEEKVSIALDDLIKGTSGSQFLYRWTCSKCGEAYPTRSAYQEHKKSCTADPDVDHPWRCHKCPNTYKNKKDLVRHLLYCGNETERHICERCGSTYKYERGLKRHKIYCGTDVKPMVCNACGKTYKYKRGLRRHQKQQCGLIESFLESRSAKGRGSDATSEHSKSPVKAVTSGKLPSATVLRQSEQIVEEELASDAPVVKDGNAPAVCQTCGKVYKYKKSYLNHVVICVPSEDQEEEEDDEDPDGTPNVTFKAEVHAAQEDSDQITVVDDQIVDDQPLDDEPSMDDKAMEQEIDELVALKKELESEDLKSVDKEDTVVLEESQNNNIEDQLSEEKATEEPAKT